MTETWLGSRMLKSEGSSLKACWVALVRAEATPTAGAAKPADRTPPAPESRMKTRNIETTWAGERDRPRAGDFDMGSGYVEAAASCCVARLPQPEKALCVQQVGAPRPTVRPVASPRSALSPTPPARASLAAAPLRQVNLAKSGEMGRGGSRGRRKSPSCGLRHEWFCG